MLGEGWADRRRGGVWTGREEERGRGSVACWVGAIGEGLTECGGGAKLAAL